MFRKKKKGKRDTSSNNLNLRVQSMKIRGSIVGDVMSPGALREEESYYQVPKQNTKEIGPIEPLTTEKIMGMHHNKELNARERGSLNTVLHKAILKKNKKIIKLLLSIPYITKQSCIIPNKEGDTVIHLAIREKSISDQELLLFFQLPGSKVVMNKYNAEKITPLMLLFQEERSLEVIKTIQKQYGGNVNKTDDIGNNVLFELFEEINEKSIKYIEYILAPVKIFDSVRTLSSLNPELNDFKEKWVIDVNHQNEDGETILHMICQQKNKDHQWVKMLKFLLSIKKLNPNVKDLNGSTPRDTISYEKDQIKFDKVFEEVRGIHKEGIEKTPYKLEEKEKDKGDFHFKKAKVIEELLNTESFYVESIRFLFDHYFSEVEKWSDGVKAMKRLYNIAVPGEREIRATGIFEVINSIKVIIDVNGEFLEAFKKVIGNRKIFNVVSYVETDIYKQITKEGQFGKLLQYYQFYSNTQKTRSELISNDKLKKYINKKERKSKEGLDSFLIKPIQRLPRYMLLLREIKKIYNKYNKINHMNYKYLENSYNFIQEFVEKIDKKKLEVKKSEKKSMIYHYLRNSHKVDISAYEEETQLQLLFSCDKLTIVDSHNLKETQNCEAKLYVFNNVIFLGITVQKKDRLVVLSKVETKKNKAILGVYQMFLNNYIYIQLKNEFFFMLRLPNNSEAKNNLKVLVGDDTKFSLGVNFLFTKMNQENVKKVKEHLNSQAKNEI